MMLDQLIDLLRWWPQTKPARPHTAGDPTGTAARADISVIKTSHGFVCWTVI